MQILLPPLKKLFQWPMLVLFGSTKSTIQDKSYLQLPYKKKKKHLFSQEGIQVCMLFLDRCCEDERKIKHFHPTKYKFLSRLLCSGKNRIFLSKINSKKKKKLLSSLLMDLKREDGMGGRGEVVSYRRFFS